MYDGPVQTPEDLARNSHVRQAVLATVTLQEALRTLQSRAGKPWCDALLLRFTDGISADAEIAHDLGTSARQVLNLPEDYAR